MEIKEQVRLRFKGVDFPSVHLTSSNPFVLTEDKEDDDDVDIDIQPKAFIPEGSNNTFKIIMDVKLSVENKFSLTVTGIGHFELSDTEVNAETRAKFMNVNATAILFPYIRAFISSLTANLGRVTKPIIIPTRFFHGELEIIKQDETATNNENPE